MTSVAPVSLSIGPHLGFAAPDCSWSDGSSLLVPAQDLGHTAMGHPELAGDDTGSNAMVGHLHYLMSDVVGKRPAVDEHTAELVHSALS